MMRRPRFSKRSLIAPVRLRRVASGLMIDSVRSISIHTSRRGRTRRLYRREEWRATDGRTVLLRFAFPTRCRLLPIGQVVTGVAGPAPAATRCLHRSRVIAVEQIGTAGKGVKVSRFETIDKDDHRSAVRIFLQVSKPDRLNARIAVARRAVRQERGFLVGPQQSTQMLDAFG